MGRLRKGVVEIQHPRSPTRRNRRLVGDPVPSGGHFGRTSGALGRPAVCRPAVIGPKESETGRPVSASSGAAAMRVPSLEPLAVSRTAVRAVRVADSGDETQLVCVPWSIAAAIGLLRRRRAGGCLERHKQRWTSYCLFERYESGSRQFWKTGRARLLVLRYGGIVSKRLVTGVTRHQALPRPGPHWNIGACVKRWHRHSQDGPRRSR